MDGRLATADRPPSYSSIVGPSEPSPTLTPTAPPYPPPPAPDPYASHTYYELQPEEPYHPQQMQHVQTFAEHIFFACIVFFLCNFLFGLIAFILAG